MTVLSAHRSIEWIGRLSQIEAALATVMAQQNEVSSRVLAAVRCAHDNAKDTRNELLTLTVAPVAAEMLEQV